MTLDGIERQAATLLHVCLQAESEDKQSCGSSCQDCSQPALEARDIQRCIVVSVHCHSARGVAGPWRLVPVTLATSSQLRCL